MSWAARAHRPRGVAPEQGIIMAKEGHGVRPYLGGMSATHRYQHIA